MSQNSLHRLVVFLLDEQRYAVPMSAVEQVVPMVAVSPLPRSPAIALGVINLHGTHSGYLTKPIDVRRFLEIVDEVLRTKE